MELGLQEPGYTCDDCRWKVERDTCPYKLTMWMSEDFYDYNSDNPHAEDCIDFRYINDPDSKF